jgi:hypothetical protein
MNLLEPLASRVRAHQAFDRLWLGGNAGVAMMPRNAAYRWLGQVLGMPKELAHIRFLSVEQCEQLIAAVAVKLAELQARQQAARQFIVAELGRHGERRRRQGRRLPPRKGER